MNSESEIKTKKLVVSADMELPSLIRALRKESASQIILTFVEDSDLLVSSVNFKVLLDVADELGKVLVAQILQHKAGERNAAAAGFTVTTSSGTISEMFWQDAQEQMEIRRSKKREVLRSSNLELVEKTALNRDDIAENPNNKEHVINSESDESVANTDVVKSEDDNNNIVEESVEQSEGGEEVNEVTENLVEVPPVEEEKPLSQFQQQVRNALSKSKNEISQNYKNRTVNQGGVTVALDHAISDSTNQTPPISTPSYFNGASNDQGSSNKANVKVVIENSDSQSSDQEVINRKSGITNYKNQKNSLIGKDFQAERDVSMDSDESFEPSNRTLGTRFGSSFNRKDRLYSKGSPASFVLPALSRFLAILKSGNYKKILFYVGAPLLTISLFVAYYLYTYTPFVKVDVYITSRAVSTEHKFIGDPSITALNIETEKVPVKKETVEREVSESAQTTGVAVRGEKAGGVVRILCYLDATVSPTVTIPSGTVLTEQGGKTFITLGEAIIDCPGQQAATVQAVEVGPESNLSSGSKFTVTGYPFESVNGTNLTSFSGGTKEEYSVVSQEDYDKLVERLKTSTFEGTKSELNRKAVDGWTIIESTIENKVVGDPEVDAAVGTEADQINVSIKTSSTALYYRKGDLEKVSSDLLLKAARSQNLFETDSDTQLKLDQNITSEVTIESVDLETNTVTVISKVSGTVKPEVNKELIASGLSDKSWDEGIKFLENLKFVAKPTDVKFSPEWFPANLRYFPGRKGSVQITIKEIKEEVPAVSEVEQQAE